jgi:predicted nucleic acid-binding protein
MRVVLDSGPIIHLSWIDALDLLATLFEEVFLPSAVRDEILAAPAETVGLDRIRAALSHGWLRVDAARPPPVTLSALGQGEREAIVLTEQIKGDLLITDDAAARVMASHRGITVTGTLGVLREARQQGFIPAVLPLLLELRQRGQWISETLIDAVRQVEESP